MRVRVPCLRLEVLDNPIVFFGEFLALALHCNVWCPTYYASDIRHSMVNPLDWPQVRAPKLDRGGSMKKILICGMLLGLLTGVGVAQRGRTMGNVGPTARSAPNVGVAPSARTIGPNTGIAPNARTVGPNAGIAANARIAPNATTVGPNATTVNPNAVKIGPNATTVAPHAKTVPDSAVTPSAKTVAPDARVAPQQY
jgi:hypothetical protein